MACALLATTVVVLIPAAGFSIEMTKLGVVLLVFPIVGTMLATVRQRTGLLAVPVMLECLLQIMYAMVFSVLASFLLAGFAAPYSDTLLVQADALVGFDWLQHADYVQKRPWLRATLAMAYGTLAWQSPVAICLLGLLGNLRRLQIFVLAFILSLVVTVALSGVLPAKAAFGHFQLLPLTDYPISGTIPAAFELIEELLGHFSEWHAEVTGSADF